VRRLALRSRLRRAGMTALAAFACAPFVSCRNHEAGGASAPLMVWHWMSDREDAFKELADRYKAQTGHEVRFDLYAPSEAYMQKVRASAQTQTLPDIFGVLGESRDLASFVRAGHLYNIAPELDVQGGAWRSRFYGKALETNEFKPGNRFGVTPGVYGIPIDITTIQFLYNKNLFKKAGLDPEKPPETWEEFLADGKKIAGLGMPGMVSGWGEIWMIDCLASNLAFNVMGEKKVMATYEGAVPYTDPDWIHVFSLFDGLAKSKILAEDIVTMVNKSAEQLFANERAGMAFNGSWAVNVYDGMNPSLNYGVFPTPKAVTSHSAVVWGAAGSSFMVNAKSPRAQAAVRFLQWLTEKPQQELLVKSTRNLPAVKDVSSTLSAPLAKFADGMEISVHPSRYPVNEAPAVVERFDKAIQSILIGEKTPRQAADDVEAAKEEERSKVSQ
jgi:ABC-type glycerol-3-phosphate transport system substrate-binding protein